MGMQLRFYWDIYFLLDFIMNLFLLGMTALLRRKAIRKGRLFGAALAGSGGMTAAMVSILSGAGRRVIPGHGPAAIFLIAASLGAALLMLRISFSDRSFRERMRNLFTFFQVSLLTGGAVLFCAGAFSGTLPYGEKAAGDYPGAWLILSGTAGVCAVICLIQRMAGGVEKKRHTMDGILYAADGQEYALRVFIDTGNQLISPYSGERVQILAKDMAERMDIGQMQHPLWIPYHSIGGDGMLPAYRMPALILQDGSRLEDFLVAVSPQISEAEGIQMIIQSER